MSKQSLYYFDSSDDENEDKVVRTNYSRKNIWDTLARIKKPYLEPSYILTEVSQSIFEQQVVQEKYTKLKGDLSKDLQIPKNLNCKGKTDSKFLGKLLIDGFSDSKVLVKELDEDANILINKILETGATAKINLKTFKINLEDLDLFKSEGMTEKHIRNTFLGVCAKLLKILETNNTNVKTLTEEIIAQYNNKKCKLSTILNTAQNQKKVNFQNLEEKLKLLENITVEDFVKDVAIKFNSDSLKQFYDTVIRESYTARAKEDKDNHMNIIFSKKDQKTKQQEELLIQYNEFMKQYFPKDSKELCCDVDGKYLNKNKFALLISCVLDDHEGMIKNTNAVLAEYFSHRNDSIVKELISRREMLPVFESGIDYFTSLRLDHRIIKAKLKTNGILEKEEIIHSARGVKNQYVSVQTKLTINSNGTREDYKFLPNDQGSYESIAMELTKFNGVSIPDNIKNILRGKELISCSAPQKIYLCRLADLLFNCEGERNVSAFLTNIMFFELVKKGVYKVSELPNRLPMAMKGAIQASRYTLDMLGGRYEAEDLQTYLTKRQYFDYKSTTYEKQSSVDKMQIEKSTQTQRELKEILLHYELTLKDRVILSDWINTKHDDHIDHLISITNITNRIYDINTKDFDGKDVSHIEQKNKVCATKLIGLLKDGSGKIDPEYCVAKKPELEKMKQNIMGLIEKSDLKSIASNLQSYVSEIREKLTIKPNLDLYHSVVLVEECIQMVDEYDHMSNLIKTKLSEEIYTTNKKIKKEVQLDNIGTFKELFEYCTQLKKTLPNFTSKLLEIIKNNLDFNISKLLQLKINGDTFKDLQNLINEWYGIELDYLSAESYKKDIKIEADNDLKPGTSKVNDIFKQFQSLSKEDKEAFLEKIKSTELKGSEVSSEERSIGYIDSYFGKYTLDAFSDILDLRLKNLKYCDIKTLPGVFVDQKHNSIAPILLSVFDGKPGITLVPLNLFNKHAAGLIFEKASDNSIQIKYLDPENNPIPPDLEQIFNDYNLNSQQIILEQQKYANCAPKVIEDFIFYLTGKCLSQEEAIPFHSMLVEESLLQGNYLDFHQIQES